MLLTKTARDLSWRPSLQSVTRGKVLFDVPMSEHTTFGVGGPADAWVEPADADALAAILSFCQSHRVPLLLVGHGTNLLVRDGGIRGVVIRLAAPAFREIRVEGNRVIAGAGVSNVKLVEVLKTFGLTGMEFICGIPGCVGGGVAMNAGAHGSAFADHVSWIQVMSGDGAIRTLSRSDLQFEYRNLRNLPEAIVLGASFELAQEDRQSIASRVNEMLEIRNATQPKGSSPGCVFKNPQGRSAGKIIDEMGLKGMRVGGAWVSELHGNFILNDRRASSAQVLELIEKVQTAVLARSGIHLETEVRIVGEP